MAEFCNPCARKRGLPLGDFADVERPGEKVSHFLPFQTVLCECCGVCKLDWHGESYNDPTTPKEANDVREDER